MNYTSPIFRFITWYTQSSDPRSAGFLSGAYALGWQNIDSIQCADLYFIQGDLDETALDLLAQTLLGDPVTQKTAWRQVGSAWPAYEAGAPGMFTLEVALRPGVTDPVAEQIVRAAHEMGLSSVKNASTGLRFLVSGTGLVEDDLHRLAYRLLANPVIQRYTLGEINVVFPQTAAASEAVDILPVRSMDDAQLLSCSDERRAALDLAEMRAIQDYFRTAGRDCTDVEFEMIAQTWSEHCVHKTFKAMIDTPQPSSYPPQVDGILNTYIRRATEEIAAPWVISAFTDNAGIIEFDDRHEISFKVETHNHPSAIEPFGGANTGVGGVIRDILGVSARPIAATDILCFGPQDTALEDLPEGVLHPRRIFAGVTVGVQDYGNKMGIPTVNGAVWFDPGYTANPLVYCGCVGLSPRGLHPSNPEPGDRVIVLGGRTGRDGLRGATFSSMTMDARTGEVSGSSVQIGDPITEKGVMEVLLAARDRGLYTAVTDCGAGGLSSAVGEMAAKCGAKIELERAPLKYPGLAPWEIWLSEAQERMVIAVPPANLPALRELCDLFGVEMTDIGSFTASGRVTARYAGKVVLDLDVRFLHHGIPQRRLYASPPAQAEAAKLAASTPALPDALLALLAHPNIASKETVIRIYDHEVQGGTCIKPLSGPGAGPSDACVLKPARTSGNRGIVISNGFNPQYGRFDPYRMAVCALDEAVRNAVASGADPQRIAVLDNFCWGDPLCPENLWALLEASRGCYDAALAYQTPFISGKDSLNNEYLTCDGQRQSIPPSLLISAIGLAPDVRRAMTIDFKKPGSAVYLVGGFQPVFGGSHFALCFGMPPGFSAMVPLPAPQTPQVYHALHEALSVHGLVLACHDLSEGGLAVATAEMCIGGRLGVEFNLPEQNDELINLYGESAGCLLVEVAAGRETEFETLLTTGFTRRIGRVRDTPFLSVFSGGQEVFTLPVEMLAQAWRTPLT